MTHSTEDLLKILDQELQATWRGERLVLSSEHRLDNPVIAKALGSHKLSKVFAFQDFREQIHQYQREHNVSGLIWRECRFQGHQVWFPELHSQLTAIPADKASLMAAKSTVLTFWHTASANLRVWRAGHEPKEIARETLVKSMQRAEWAEVCATREELYLSLCWGNPKEYYCDWAYPESGCDRIIATAAHPSAIKM
jgi:hypothetical protein